MPILHLLRIWPAVTIVPTMSVTAIDGRLLNAAGIPTHGVTGIFTDAAGSGAHGTHERIRVKSLLEARRFLQELVRVYTQDGD